MSLDIEYTISMNPNRYISLVRPLREVQTDAFLIPITNWPFQCGYLGFLQVQLFLEFICLLQKGPEDSTSGQSCCGRSLLWIRVDHVLKIDLGPWKETEVSILESSSQSSRLQFRVYCWVLQNYSVKTLLHLEQMGTACLYLWLGFPLHCTPLSLNDPKILISG